MTIQDTHPYHIIEELNLSNSSKYKRKVLQKYADDFVLRIVMGLTYDKVTYTYGITLDKVLEEKSRHPAEELTLANGIELLKELSNRVLTGNAALEAARHCINSLNYEDAEVFKMMLDRDLKINMGIKQINKAMGLIDKPAYMRCAPLTRSTVKLIEYPAVVQLKYDGTYCEVSVLGSVVKIRTRSGTLLNLPTLEAEMKKLSDGIYLGELLVEGIGERKIANGLLNSSNPPHDKIIFFTWDKVSHCDYNAALAGYTPEETYYTRYRNLTDSVDHVNRINRINRVDDLAHIYVVESFHVSSIEAALRYARDMMNIGMEGAILKDARGLFKNGTSNYNLKIKMKIQVEMRITGFQPGAARTKFEGQVGSIEFANDEMTVVGRTSGMTDAMRKAITEKQESLIGAIITVEFNELTKAEGHDHYALSHPRFITIRTDKTSTDTLADIHKMRESMKLITV